MTNSGSPDSGQRIGAYEIQRLLGRGGMGEVFLAWDARLRRQVAIKRVRADRGIDSPSRQRLLREARAVAGLNHPAIVQVHDLIEDAAGDCIVLEYVEGKTLAATLAGGALEPALAVRLAHEVADGLAAAHEAGIVHRDLKPENVIITLSGHAKILDFGLARARTRAMDDMLLTQHGVLLGTFHMMSPEQASGGDTDERSDLFSLGIVLYEMLTGISPFLGATPSETLKRVLSEDPPRVDAVRPGLPARLGDLVEHLLAKRPEDRPGGAAEVAWELAAVAACLAASAASTLTASVSDLPTVIEAVRPATPLPLSRRLPAPDSTVGMSSPHRFGTRRLAIACLGVAVAGVLAFLMARLLIDRKPEAPAAMAPLRVVVPRPQVSGADERLQLAASGVLTASLGTLGSLQGVAAIDPLQLVGSPGSVVEMSRVAAADEVLVTTLETAGSLARITLRRVHGSDGRVLWTDTLDAPIDSQDLRLLAEAVGIRLRRGFPDHPPRPGALPLDVSDEDYAAFLDIKQRIDAGQTPPEPEWARLEQIIGRSPRFLEARTLGASVAFSLFQSTREVAYRDRARALVREAEALAPGDPRPLQKRFRIELALDSPETAAATLSRLESLLPEDPQNLTLRASLAEREGRPEEAMADLRKAVDRVPSWQNLYWLAKLEARHGRLQDARRHLDQLLAGSPGNIWALQKLGEIELEFGDLRRAKQIYQDLIARSPQRNYWTNLGVSEVLLAQYEDAVAAFRQALAITPNHVETTLDLADAELALGRTREATNHYRQVLQRLEKERPPGGPSPADSMIEAQCLARLGRTREAVELTQGALQQSPTDSEILQSAALVYTLVGDRASALVNLQKALERGVQPRWFTLPAYAPFFKDPEFQRLVGPAR